LYDTTTSADQRNKHARTKRPRHKKGAHEKEERSSPHMPGSVLLKTNLDAALLRSL